MRCCGIEVWAYLVCTLASPRGDASAHRLEYALNCLQSMLHHPRAIGQHGGCKVAMPAPVVRLPVSHVYAVWPQAMGCHLAIMVELAKEFHIHRGVASGLPQ